ncbi:MAG TPA: choice-of-anchor tandem repeat GloVer-containing protein [Candidatus Acidoferrum sp.]|nr:choice-of-anchor tandem repeat GloVer-containing protein [Candidatus Acidoferrum sp.]
MKTGKVFSALARVFLWGAVACQAQAGVTLTTLVSFNQTNGSFPTAGLMQALDGNFYGTTTYGGLSNYGTIFQLTPAGTFTRLISFVNTNGALPRAGLVQGTDGNFYGTTYNGGSSHAGIAFQLATNGTLTTMATFAFATGGYPLAGLVQGQDGNFYGTTAIGGANVGGTAFQLMTNQTLTTLVSFDNSTLTFTGGSPYGTLVQASDGNLYGTTSLGGTNGGFGTIFKLTTNGTLTCLHAFTGLSDGGNPYAGLVQGADGSFYGTTGAYASTNQSGTNYGTVFRLSANGTFTTLVSFAITNGADPRAGLVQGMDGNLYGTTSVGGVYSNVLGVGYGTIFKIGTNGGLTMLFSFNGTNGAAPEAPLIQASDGNFYGTTQQGGTNGYGTIFRLSIATPPPPNFLKVESAGATVVLTWSATVGQLYQMLYKTDLNQATWNNLNGPIAATNTTMITIDSIGPDPQRFYRILMLP